MVQTSIQPVGFDQKTCNIRAIVARSGGWRAARASESLTTAGDYAIFHWVRSRLDAGLPRSPQNSAGPKGSRTLEFLSFSGPTQAWAVDKLARDHGRQENSRSSAQVPGKQWQTKGRGCAQLIVRLRASGAGGRGEEAITRGLSIERFWRLTGRAFRLWSGR